MSEKRQHLGLGCRTPPWTWATFQSKVLCSMNLPARSNTDLRVKGRGSGRLAVPGTGFREQQVFPGQCTSLVGEWLREGTCVWVTGDTGRP